VFPVVSPDLLTCWKVAEESKMPEQPSPAAMKAAARALAAMGGHARARKLSKARLSEIGRMGAAARRSRAKRSKAKRP
jgi:hypothetical protein